MVDYTRKTTSLTREVTVLPLANMMNELHNKYLKSPFLLLLASSTSFN